MLSKRQEGEICAEAPSSRSVRICRGLTESDSRLVNVRRHLHVRLLELSETQNVTYRNRERKTNKKRKKNSYIIPVFFSFVLGHFLNSIYLYPYIFLYIFIYSFYN